MILPPPLPDLEGKLAKVVGGELAMRRNLQQPFNSVTVRFLYISTRQHYWSIHRRAPSIRFPWCPLIFPLIDLAHQLLLLDLLPLLQN